MISNQIFFPKIRMKNIRNTPYYAMVGILVTKEVMLPKRNMNAEKVIEAVCKRFGISRTRLEEKTRKHEVVMARYLCMFFLRRYTNLSLKDVGKIFNRRLHHTTVIHGCRKVNNWVTTNDDFRDHFKNIELQIQ